MKLLKNNSANISMDFLTAISILLIVMIYAVSALPTFFTPYTSENNYQHLDSTLSVLISPNNENGFALSHSSIIDGNKVAELYTTHEDNLNWYELSDTQTFRNLGFEKHQYYSQIIPVDTTKYNAPLTEQSAKSHVPELCNTDLVVRHKLLTYTESGVFYGDELYGKIPSDKVIIYFDKDDVNNIKGNTTMTFKDFILEDDDGTLISFEVGTEIGSSEEIKTPKGISPSISVNGEFVDITGLIVINSTDIIKITISEEQLNEAIYWQDGFYFQFNVGDIIIEDGTTDYNSSVRMISEPYKISVWSWFNE